MHIFIINQPRLAKLNIAANRFCNATLQLCSFVFGSAAHMSDSDDMLAVVARSGSASLVARGSCSITPSAAASPTILDVTVIQHLDLMSISMS